MRIVCQRVLEAEVKVGGRCVGKIGRGLLVFLGVGKGDTETDAAFIADKIVNLRIFADEGGKMNLSIRDLPADPRGGRGGPPPRLASGDAGAGGVLLVSNFTLHGDCRKGRRPGFDAAAEPALAQQLYERVCALVAEQGVHVEKGIFGEYMHVANVNDGPVTFILDSSRLF